MKVKTILNSIAAFSNENSNAILTGIIIAGTVTTSALSIRAGMRYRDIIENTEAKKKTRLSRKEKVLIATKEFLPVVIVGGVVIAASIGNMRTNSKRLAAITTAYNVAVNERDSIQKAIETVVDKETKDKIEDTAVKETVKEAIQNVKSDKPSKGKCSDEEIKFLDPYSGRYFYSSNNEIEAAINTINEMVVHGENPTLNDLYEQLELGSCDLGAMFDWDINTTGLIHKISDATVDEGDIPVGLLTLYPAPRFNGSC